MRFIKHVGDEAEVPILWPPDVKSWLIGKRPWCWERLKVKGEGDDRGWDGWMASPTWWTWIWVSSGRWWWKGRPGVLRCMGVAKSWTWPSNWNGLNPKISSLYVMHLKIIQYFKPTILQLNKQINKQNNTFV